MEKRLIRALISGDIAYAGDKHEYDFALQWLEDFCTKCGTTPTSVFVIPGNHDVVRNIASRQLIQVLHHDIKGTSDISLDGMLRGLLTDSECARLLYESIEPYNLFAQQFFCDLLPPERTIAKRDLTLNDGSVLRLSGLNSTFVSSAADKHKDLFVDPAAFQITQEPGVENLVLCHHPYSWLRQGITLQDHLNDVARIQLFGHEHTSRIELARDYVRVAASAAHPDRTESGWEPGYNLIQLKVISSETQRQLAVKVHVRVWQSRPEKFIAKKDRTGEDFFHQDITLDAWQSDASMHAPVVTNAVKSENNMQINVESAAEPTSSEPLRSLREICIRFFKLTLSQKAAIAGKLNLLEDEDINQPDFERFRRVFLRAREQNLVEALDNEVTAIISK